ncbi:MAG: ribosomal RNA small subunit methyltransferase H [Candidatus Hepatoplasma scabrum]|nr:MAG: ribosomal RNA small subunit methyltransferase H [Candidatus Hepatoplasma sp.]
MINHETILLKEATEKLRIKEDGIYVDATLGLGGHSKSILKKLVSGKLIAIDQDLDAINFAKERLKEYQNVIFIHGNFKDLKMHLEKINIKKIDGIIYDLGTSYYQLTDLGRGFTYRSKDIFLDMRMDQKNQKLTASMILNTYPEEKLLFIFKKYAEEKLAKKLVQAIIEYRNEKKIVFNHQLNEIIVKIKPYNKQKNRFRNIYQGLRIEVNNEIDAISKSLLEAAELLNKNGRILVITFHSLEDRIVKNIFFKFKNLKKETQYQIIRNFRTLKTVYPSKKEIEKNNSSRSSRMRILEKINEF